MKFFIDSASLSDIREAVSWGVFSGVTINPVLMARETSDFEGHARQVFGSLPAEWDVSLEVHSGEPKEMVDQARTLHGWDKRVRVKLPSTVEGLKAAAALVADVPLNLTIIKSAAQGLVCGGLLSQHDDADVVLSVFCGRLRQAGHDWQQLIRTLARAQTGARVLAASIKTPSDISDAIYAGAEIITAPLDVYRTTFASPLVSEDVEAFDAPFEAGGLQSLLDRKS
jgi:transaldolase